VAGYSFFIKDIFATSSAITETIYTANGTTTKATTKVLKPAETRKIGQIETMNFVDRATGHIYETATSTLDLTKISNTTIPKIYDASFITKESLILRNLYEGSDIIKTMHAVQKTMSPTTTDKVLTTKELTADLRELALSPNKSKILYTQNKGATLSIANIDGTSQITAFESPFKEWLIQWPKDNIISLTTKPTAFAPGYMYSLNPTTHNSYVSRCD
jgi:DNA-binding beta-propeller fold protein YncE